MSSDTPKWKKWLGDIRNSFAKHPDEAYLKQVQRAQPKKQKVQAKPGEQPLPGYIPEWQLSEHRWQSIDYSNCMYSQDRHPNCRGFSRTFSDLREPRPVVPAPCPAGDEEQTEQQPDGEMTNAELTSHHTAAVGDTEPVDTPLQKQTKPLDQIPSQRQSSCCSTGSTAAVAKFQAAC